MLYCPKCQATYEDGTQRFCTNEGARLLPYAASEKSVQSSKGVFSSILSKSSQKKEDSFSADSKSVIYKSQSTAFQPPAKSKFFKGEEKDETLKDSEPVAEEILDVSEDVVQKKSFEPLPLARIINPSLIPEKQVASDKIFLKNPENKKVSDFEQRDVLETFEAETEDFLEVDEKENSSFTENFDELDKTQDVPFKLIEPPEIDDFELNLDKNETVFSQSDADFNLDLDFDEATEIKNSSLKVAEPDAGIELDLDDLGDISTDLETPPKIELDLDEIGTPVFSTTDSTPLELNLERRKEVNIANSIPKIELNLTELEDISFSQDTEKESDLIEETKKESKLIEETEKDSENIVFAPVSAETTKVEEKSKNIKSKQTKKGKTKDSAGTGKIKATEDTAWEKRSIDSSGDEESKWFLYPLIGIVILALGLLGFFYLTNQNNAVNEEQSNVQTENVNQPETNTSVLQSNENSAEIVTDERSEFQEKPNLREQPKPDLIEVPPPPRNIKQPPNTIYFKNEKKNLKGKLSQEFLGFSIYFPKTWKQNKSENKFLDISRTTPEGLPIKQLMIERYDSKGTYLADKPLFKELAEKSHKDLRGILSNYQVISEEETTFQNGRWQVYEVRFQGIGSDKKLIIWGRRLWIPVQRPGMRSGFIITMLGTSLSDDVKSVNDLGENDDLAEILKTFEPEIN